MVLTRFLAGLGLGIAQLRHYRARTILSIIAIALAVLSVTLLASVGVGVLETGAEKFDRSGQDLWVSKGPTRITPGSVGGLENSIVNSHALARQIRQHEDVALAGPIAFQTVYVGSDPSNLQTVVGVGVPNVGTRVLSVQEGQPFSTGDAHYAGGTYDGPMTKEIIIDSRTATKFNVTVGDTLHIGGTIASARSNEFQIVGISSTFTRLLGTASVAVHLSELQTLTGTAQTDRAALISVKLAADTAPEVVANELEASYPNYEFRTNREQLQSTIRGQAVVLAGAGVLVLLGITAGIALTWNAFALLVYQQQVAMAALKAGGVSTRTLWLSIVGQALIVGAVGGGIGLLLTPVAVAGLNYGAMQLVGFEGLVQTRPWIYLSGLLVSLGIGLIGSGIAGWRLAKLRPHHVLI